MSTSTTRHNRKKAVLVKVLVPRALVDDDMVMRELDVASRFLSIAVLGSLCMIATFLGHQHRYNGWIAIMHRVCAIRIPETQLLCNVPLNRFSALMEHTCIVYVLRATFL